MADRHELHIVLLNGQSWLLKDDHWTLDEWDNESPWFVFTEASGTKTSISVSSIAFIEQIPVPDEVAETATDYTMRRLRDAQ